MFNIIKKPITNEDMLDDGLDDKVKTNTAVAPKGWFHPNFSFHYGLDKNPTVQIAIEYNNGKYTVKRYS